MLTMQVVRLRLCWSQTHRFLRNFVGDLIRLVEEAHGRDVAQRSKTPEGEEEGEGEESMWKAKQKDIIQQIGV